ncbi:choice-of-anchor L domain-containing protein [Mariniflexile litorale]|uniref:Choice-of-anchor L domain-containing protein n=1 Tax=Mariniflexile litorale TaxID=3045158 RepID=A0AAU7EGL0_9FLAO|nr:choice-of-anchor L domain-containing protein [Mariniflexile sp. KMM 9835]MDQ8210785.1 choice-of-anchor L domain-containing protein [Mariniflexile sp. KMM 9835]
MFSQQITVDDSVGLQQLIEDNLVQNSCVDITNITSSVNGSASGFSSYAYFERGSSNFPFQNGIMLSTGNATSGGNGVRTPTLSEGASNWGTDPDLETALGITNTVNATSIEFDIVSISNQLQFNYLLASEEYFGINPCQFSDGFVFLIKETGSAGPYQNIALVPGTSTPVNTNTIHDEIFGVCPAQNPQYFDGYNTGDTNYNGRTTILTASTTITPYVQYHIKLIIADQNDIQSDSAVFIEGDSFKILDLGNDITTCASLTTLDADIQNASAFYQWYLNNNLIVGAVDPTLDVIQNGTYKVEVSVSLNGNTCVEEDEIVVVLNTEEPIASITNYQLCDDASGDNIEVFDLSTKTTELDTNIPFDNYAFSYHYSDIEARGNFNEITTPIPNTSNPQTIYVRIDDLDSNCFSYTTFDLVVNQVPNIVAPTPLEVCDTDDSPDGYAVVYLNEKDAEITNGQSNLSVSYHSSPADANTGNNPLGTPYINTNTSYNYNVYPRITNTQTGCVITTSLNVNITVSPIVIRDTRYLDACDADHDGFADFDLTEIINDIENGLTDVTTTFHESEGDAQTGTNPIANTTNYQNINPEEQTIYVRVEDNNTGCASVVPLEIHTNLLLTATDTGDYALCDTNDDATDTYEFNLYTIETYIANDLPFPIEVTFYESEFDRDNNINPIPKNVPYNAISPKILYVKIENTDTGCSDFESITLLVNPILLFAPTTPLPYCDLDDDGIVDIDLHSLDNIITNGNTDFNVTYFASDLDAQNNSPELPPFFTNTQPIETLFARIENRDTGCHTVNSFQIEVLVAPATSPPTDVIICDNDQDGFSIINLNDKIDEAVANRTGLNISVHTSFDDADTGANPILDSDLNTYNSNTQTLYIRVQDALSSTGCYAIEPFEVIVNTLPDFPFISNYQVCEDDGDRFADFLLSEKDAEILNGQIGKEVFYFEDAAFTIPIDENTIYQNKTSPQTIYVKVENITDASCFGTSSFVIQVSPDPVYNVNFEDYLVCDDTSNDGKNIFNLNEKRTEISQGSTDNLNISFHLTRLQAEGNSNPLPAQYTNVSNPQTIFVRIESSDSLCFIIEELGINIIAAPAITNVSAPLIACDADYDGSTPFNLETADFQINDRVQSNLIINYFANLSDINPNDGRDNSNEIPNPSSYNSTSKTVYIKVANTLTGCYSVIPLELIVNLPPPTNTIGTIQICDNDTDTYDLSLVNNMVVNNTNGITISYHDSQTDAGNNINPLSNIYNYTASNHIIYVRVSDNITGCSIVQEFYLHINQNPIANTPANLISCDDDFDGFFEFNLSVTASEILGTQNANTHTITYYNDSVNAEAGTNSLANLHAAFNGEIIYARIENNTTGCYAVTQFSTIVNPLPIIPINDIVPLCINDLPLTINASTGNVGDTYLWTTNANFSVNNTTNSEIQLDITDLGIYAVTVTTPNNCEYTKTFSVIESQQAELNFTTTVDFADPNSITVDISGIGDYVYILDDGEPQTSNVFENVTFGIHLVTIRDLNGCEDVTTEVVVIDIPKFFTPNNDGFFDTWHIVGIEQLPGTIVYIYNRYGKLLKTLLQTSHGWDGTYNGNNMPSDDYWFVAEVIQDGNAFQVKGHFALKR